MNRWTKNIFKIYLNKTYLLIIFHRAFKHVSHLFKPGNKLKIIFFCCDLVGCSDL